MSGYSGHTKIQPNGVRSWVSDGVSHSHGVAAELTHRCLSADLIVSPQLPEGLGSLEDADVVAYQLGLGGLGGLGRLVCDQGDLDLVACILVAKVVVVYVHRDLDL